MSVTETECNSVKYLEHVTVQVTFSYAKFRGMTALYLVSPSGTRSHLLTKRTQDASDNIAAGSHTWTYMSVHFWGESPLGDWTLEIKSEFDNNDGR